MDAFVHKKGSKMATYILSYVLHTDIKQGDKAVYSNKSYKHLEIIATDDKKAKKKVKKAWKKILLEEKVPSSAVIFTNFFRKVNWQPSATRVQYDSKSKLVP